MFLYYYSKRLIIIDSLKLMNKFTLIILIITIVYPITVCHASETNKSQPYFRVTYEIPKMPAEIASKEAAEKNLQLYKQHLQKNKRLMAENALQEKRKESLAKLHNEITLNILKEDRREHIRFTPSNCPRPITVTLYPQTSGKDLFKYKTADISRGGMGLYSNTLNVNDEVPVLIKYQNTEIKTTLKVLSNNNGRVGGKFINMDEKTNNKLIYLSSILEADNRILKTKLAPI